ncbi:MAG: Hsp20/alpha crystallin family protein [Patescibacteria group bacterium]|nr:Hsp20/alpha crystallin family protein [Patescibacteria group bacterium]MDD5490573.1 Hsp20/alpha crystallin family protein [Patescibacteria group bacterium]
MSLIPWKPFFEPFEDFEGAFGDDAFSLVPAKVKGFIPAIDVYEKDGNLMVETPLVGVDPKDVEITIENDVLTIKGKSEHKSEVEEKNFYRKEVRYGNFYRTVALPAHVDADKAKAVSENGLLKISIPKVGAPKEVKKITIAKKSAPAKKAVAKKKK